MPGFNSHYLFGISVYKDMDQPLKRIIQNHHHSYALGLQGPDLFFYHLPSVLGAEHKPGAVAHSKFTGIFLTNLAKSLSKLKTVSDYEIGVAYTAGFYAHYTLDRICHPFIYARTAYDTGFGTEHKEYFGRHCRLETDIDTVYLKREKGLIPSEFKWEDTIDLSPREEQVIGLMLHYTYRHTYRWARVSKIHTIAAARWMKMGLSHMHDPHGVKRQVMQQIEQFLFGYYWLSGMIPQDYTLVHEDPCNEHRDTWRNPWQPDVPHRDSFFDLVDKATDAYKKLLPFLEKLCVPFGELPEVPFDIAAGYSYLTGLPT